MISLSDINLLFLMLWKFMQKFSVLVQNFFQNVVLKLLNKRSLEIFSRYSSEIFPKCSSEIAQKVAKQMGKFSQSQLGIISESVNIFRISVVVSNLNSGYLDNSKFFSEVNSKYSDNSKFFSGVNSEFRTDLRIICGKNMEIHQNPVFSRKHFFSTSEKSEYSEFYFPS